MYRKVLVVVLMLSIGMVGFSKNKTEKIRNINPKELAKTVAENSQKELLGQMKRELKYNDGIKVKFNSAVKKKEQFLYQEDLIGPVLKEKSHFLGDVYDKLREKSNKPTDLTYDKVNVKKVDYKQIEKKGKPARVDSTTLIVLVPFEAHTVAKNGISNVKYEVTFEWEVKVKAKKAKSIVVGYEPEKCTLTSVAATHVDLFQAEIDVMKKKAKAAARDAIINWYADLPHRLDKQYVDQSVSAIEPITSVSASDVEKKLRESGQNFTAKGVKEISVNIDPYRFIKDKDKSLYTNPTARIIVYPSFTVTVDDSFNAKLTVSYDKIETIEPETDSAKVENYKAAWKTINDFCKSLSEYVADNSKDGREKIMIMFADSKNDEVAVSRRSKFNNKERINQRKADQYLKLLSGKNLSFESIDYIDSNKASLLNAEYPELNLSYDPNLSTIMFDATQSYEGNNYKDKTRKIIVMKKQNDNSYLIDAIIVVPNSTIIE